VDTDFTLSANYLTAGRVFLEDGFAPPSGAGERAPSRQWRIAAPLRWVKRTLLG
jgi:hypothetical protein